MEQLNQQVLRPPYLWTSIAWDDTFPYCFRWNFSGAFREVIYQCVQKEFNILTSSVHVFMCNGWISVMRERGIRGCDWGQILLARMWVREALSGVWVPLCFLLVPHRLLWICLTTWPRRCHGACGFFSAWLGLESSVNLFSDMGFLEELRLPEWLQRIFQWYLPGKEIWSENCGSVWPSTWASGPELQM